MNRMQLTTRAFAILALVTILAGCSSPTVVAPPTPDIPSIRTESAQTVVAKVTIEAALNTATLAPAAPTDTPAPSATTAPSATPTSAVTLAPAATATATLRPASGGGVPAPTITRRAGPDQAQFISQYPTDGMVFKPGEEFDAKWTFKNIGTSTWSNGFEYRFARGTNLAKSAKYTVPGDVAPGETVTLIADIVAPSEAGRYISYWELVNVNGDVFFQFYMVIDVK